MTGNDHGEGDRPGGVVHVFTPDGDRHRPASRYLRDMWQRRALVAALAHAQTRATQSESVLGRLWSLADPAFSAVIYVGLFAVLRRGSGGEQLTAVVAGVFLFAVTQTILTEGGRAIRSSKGLLLNSTFPRALLLLVPVHKAVLGLRYTVPVYVALHVLVRAPIGIGLAVLPLLIDVQLALSLGIALLLAVLTTLHRDAENALAYLMRILMFTAPVLFPAASLPDKARAVTVLNPFYGLFAAYQDAVGGRVPDVADVAQAVTWAAFFLVVGFVTFRRHEHRLVAHI